MASCAFLVDSDWKERLRCCLIEKPPAEIMVVPQAIASRASLISGGLSFPYSHEQLIA
jgi:hypothetical protein